MKSKHSPVRCVFATCAERVGLNQRTSSNQHQQLGQMFYHASHKPNKRRAEMSPQKKKKTKYASRRVWGFLRFIRSRRCFGAHSGAFIGHETTMAYRNHSNALSLRKRRPDLGGVNHTTNALSILWSFWGRQREKKIRWPGRAEGEGMIIN